MWSPSGFNHRLFRRAPGFRQLLADRIVNRLDGGEFRVVGEATRGLLDDLLPAPRPAWLPLCRRLQLCLQGAEVAAERVLDGLGHQRTGDAEESARLDFGTDRDFGAVPI